MTKRYYPAVLEHGGKGTFAVWFPDFPDCVAAGTSREQAIGKAEWQLAEAVDALAEHERQLPEPTPLEDIALPRGAKFVAYLMVGVEPSDPSERVNIYLPKSLIARADKRAGELGMSRSSFFGLAVTQAIAQSASLGMPEMRHLRSHVKQIGDSAAGKALRRGKKS